MSESRLEPAPTAAGGRSRKVSPQVEMDTGPAQRGPSPVADTQAVTVATSVPADILAETSRYYDSVCRLVDSINELTSTPSFVNHAATLVNILIDAFLLLDSVLAKDVRVLFVASCTFELSLFVGRLTAYSLGGDGVLQEGAALRRALVSVPWQRLTAQTSRQRDELLLKLQHPPAVEPLGFFTVRKGNLLSMTGLFLTYFVIIIQMVQMDKS
ncbi:hypothetical protein FJT64_018786 [Amphibalanus amphitrite]|uniref:Uncharacterized protein n=1 Tax=Amphibalanus amphitrite TaxID=1232801 RepID=A0A6A4X246_AMPAM|nr:hypothetical protein FJT64_018786 [Amphibalanus amphitrite]